MPATRWDEWVRFAKAEKPRREFTERDKLISDLEGKKYADEKAGMVGNHSRRPSPARSYVMRNDLSSIRPATVSHLSSYDDRATRSLYDTSIEGPSNQLQVKMKSFFILFGITMMLTFFFLLSGLTYKIPPPLLLLPHEVIGLLYSIVLYCDNLNFVLFLCLAAVATHYRSASPLAAAKALVSSITSGHSDMHE